MSRMQTLRLISIVGSFLVGFWFSFRLIGMHPASDQEVFLDLAVSFVAAVNIFLYFTEGQRNPRFLKSWLNLGLFADVLCLLPISLIMMALNVEHLEWLMFVNILAIRHVRKIKSFLDGFFNLDPVTYRLIPIFLSLPLLVHLISCGWIALGSGNAGDDADPLLRYVKAIYWAFTTLTTVGYGDISAKSIPQMLYCCGVQVVGVGVFGFILSNVASLLSRSDAAREHHMDNLDRIETFMRNYKIPPDLRNRTREYYHHLWNTKKGYQDTSLLEGLPSRLQAELFFEINKSIVEKVPFLMSADKEMVEDLMDKLEARTFVPNEKIFRAGDHGDALYFIHSGTVEIQRADKEPLAQLHDGAFFGEMALLTDSPRSASAVARSFVDAYVLKKESFESVTQSYPHFREHIHEIMSKRRGP